MHSCADGISYCMNTITGGWREWNEGAPIASLTNSGWSSPQWCEHITVAHKVCPQAEDTPACTAATCTSCAPVTSCCPAVGAPPIIPMPLRGCFSCPAKTSPENSCYPMVPTPTGAFLNPFLPPFALQHLATGGIPFMPGVVAGQVLGLDHTKPQESSLPHTDAGVAAAASALQYQNESKSFLKSSSSCFIFKLICFLVCHLNGGEVICLRSSLSGSY